VETELIELGAAIVALGLIMIGLRRAAAKSRERAPESARERLGLEEAAAPVKAKKPEKKPEPKPEKKPEKKEPERKAEKKEPEKPEKPKKVEAPSEEAEAYKAGLAKTRGGFVAKLGKLFGKKKIDAQTLDELEEVLFTADIGPRAAERIFQSVKTDLNKTELEDADKIWLKIRETSKQILSVDAPAIDFKKHTPFVLLVLGVNGVGKTTTIGKLAARLKGEAGREGGAGKRVLLAAGDTFRAAATEQLEEWAKRAEVEIVKGKPQGDPSSVIFDAIKRGVDEKFDVVICDTAGRLHSNAGLMDELKKVRRVADKAMPGAPHETWMVLDATTGQNAISQAKTFKADMEISGIVITKLDGSAKGGVVIGICDELKVPVRFVGLGEKIGDLRPFDAAQFVDQLYADAAPDEAA
jgi:fused signal recognition particle receptor